MCPGSYQPGVVSRQSGEERVEDRLRSGWVREDHAVVREPEILGLPWVGRAGQSANYLDQLG